MRKATLSGLLILTLIGASVSGAGPAGADPVDTASASAYGADLRVAGEPVIETAGLEEAAVPEPDPDVAPLVLVPAAPLAVSGTADGEAAAHVASDLDSTLENVSQSVEGPYNARGVGTVENLEVLFGVPEDGAVLVSATAVRGEAVALCSNGAVQYSANSEIIDLELGGEDLPLNDPVTALLTAINDALEPLAQVADIGINEVSDDGRSVTALRVTILEAAGDEPLAEVLLGHAEVGEATCGGGEEPECSDGIDNDGDGQIDFPNDPECDGPDDDSESPQCSDEADNDGDGDIDAADPGCHTDGDPDDGDDTFNPNDDDETDGACADRADNDNDGTTDFADPDCHTDGNAANPASFDPNRSENSRGAAAPARAALPKTGVAVPTAAAAGLGIAAMALLALRRRSTV